MQFEGDKLDDYVLGSFGARIRKKIDKQSKEDCKRQDEARAKGEYCAIPPKAEIDVDLLDMAYRGSLLLPPYANKFAGISKEEFESLYGITSMKKLDTFAKDNNLEICPRGYSL